ncbi:general transcription factor 3C polypeptide 4 [Aplochiton taeniatus]
MELVCDINSSNQDLVLHRTSIPLPEKICELKVGPVEELSKAKAKLSSSSDPTVSQVFMADTVINPTVGIHRGVKYTSWSPLGCDGSNRCLLASLSLDHRLTIHGSQKRLQWTTLVDLTQLYGESLEKRGYSLHGGEAPKAPLSDLAELRRRFSMQAPVRMEWSSVCTTQHIQTDNKCEELNTVLLAVLMENGDLVVWQFSLPLQGKDSVLSCNTIPSGVSSPSVLAWWEYEHSGRKMSGLIVGSATGPIRILPVNLKAVKGYFTLRQPVVLWQDDDHIPCHGIKCVSLQHPVHKCNCSLVVAARGPYVFWCLLVISKAGLNVHNSHITGLHSLPIVSMTAARQGGSVYTCSLDGTVKKLTPIFTQVAVTFKQEEVALPEGVAGRRLHGLAVSPNGAYVSLVSAEGMADGCHPVTRTYQVHFVTLKTAEGAAAELLRSPGHSLFKQADTLDLVRWTVLREKRIPRRLQEELEEQIQATGATYLLRLKLFLLRVLYQSLRTAPVDPRWKPTHEDSKVFVAGEEGGGGRGGGGGPAGEHGGEEQEPAETQQRGGEGKPRERSAEEKMEEVQGWIKDLETRLINEHMKRVLGEVFLHMGRTENTSIPTSGLCAYLSSDPSQEDRPAKVLVGHIQKKMHKQTFPEYCSLCKEVLPFTDPGHATCSNGHMWLRCVLSYRACQSVTYRRCLLQDSVARLPAPEDPDWIQRILLGPCPFCDSPLL